jgi:hypothetical protein
MDRADHPPSGPLVTITMHRRDQAQTERHPPRGNIPVDSSAHSHESTEGITVPSDHTGRLTRQSYLPHGWAERAEMPRARSPSRPRPRPPARMLLVRRERSSTPPARIAPLFRSRIRRRPRRSIGGRGRAALPPQPRATLIAAVGDVLGMSPGLAAAGRDCRALGPHQDRLANRHAREWVDRPSPFRMPGPIKARPHMTSYKGNMSLFGVI